MKKKIKRGLATQDYILPLRIQKEKRRLPKVKSQKQRKLERLAKPEKIKNKQMYK